MIYTKKSQPLLRDCDSKLNKNSNDFRSHVCRFPDEFNAPSARERKNLINILTPWFQPIL